MAQITPSSVKPSPGSAVYRNDHKGEKALRNDQPWIPYELSFTETPALFPLAFPLRYWVRLRDTLFRNAFLDWRLPVPCWKRANRLFTWVELLIVILCLAACVVAWIGFYFKTPNKDDVENSGGLAVIPTAITFALSARNSLVTLVLGIPFERQLFWHKFFSVITVVIGFLHGALATWGSRADVDDDDWPTGWIFQAFMMALVASGVPQFRRWFWNSFYFLHLILVTGTIVFGIIHEAGGIMFGVFLWFLDLVIRYLYMALLAYPHTCQVTRLPANVVRLTFNKQGLLGKFGEFRYSPGQYIFIMVPKVNVFEWHPFSLSSSPHSDLVSVHIRVLGDWTKKLHKVCSKAPLEEDPHQNTETMTVFIEGPYGAPQIDIAGEKYELILLISGGIGITPMQSICNHLLHEHENQGRPMKKIWFVWSCADKYMISAAFEHDRQWAGHMNRLPTSFQPDNVDRLDTDKRLLERRTVFDEKVDASSTGESSVLHTEFYLTRVRKEADYAEANIHPSMHKNLRFGRPDLETIFTTMRNFAICEKETKVGVLVCGPQPLVDDTRIHCYKHSNQNVRFDFHSEMFDF